MSFSRTAGEGGELARRMRGAKWMAGLKFTGVVSYFRPRSIASKPYLISSLKHLAFDCEGQVLFVLVLMGFLEI